MTRLGVVLVTYNAGDVIRACLDTLFASTGVVLSVVVVDNGSTDTTIATIADWAAGGAGAGALPFATQPAQRPGRILQAPVTGAAHSLALIETGVNGGFAAGVNRGLQALMALPALDRFWILNPDSAVPPETAARFATAPAGFALMGGRVLYFDRPELIQIDGGLIDWRTGVTRNVGQFAPATSPAPDPATFGFITGASMVAHRDFITAAGPMPEDYFLYYEEVDWALRRGTLPLAYCAGADIYHIAGSAIGSPAPGRTASAFSLYFKHRARMRFLRRYRRRALAGAWAFSLAKAAQLALAGDRAGAVALLRGSADLAPPAAIAARLDGVAASLAFAPMARIGSGERC